MDADKALFNYLKAHTWQLTEEWYQSLDKNQTDGVYASDDAKAVERLKRQNHEFHERFCHIYSGGELGNCRDFEEWIIKIAHDEGHLETSSHYIVQEFFATEEQYLDLIEQFAKEHPDVPVDKVNGWKRETIKAFGEVISWFLKEQHAVEEARHRTQQQIINRLSSPIIKLKAGIALLPLTGDFDQERADFMLENTLEICSREEIRRLLIDLSGVVKVDVMVAHQIFQLVEALKLIGVESTLSGIRPEIAQTALGYSERFGQIEIVSALSKAVDLYIK